ncbi:MAG: PIN domain-containing protein [Candidatus Njordarchaeales archaeon]
MKTRVLVDTSYLLPFFGIRVRELDERTVRELIDAFSGSEVLYPILMLPEIMAKISKELSKTGKKLSNDIIDAFNSLLGEVDIKLVRPKMSHILRAIQLRLDGHHDIFDCIAYATALEEKALFLTMDSEFIEFLKSKNYDTSLIIDHSAFLRRILHK